MRKLPSYFSNQREVKNPECIRCGTCCLAETCDVGEGDEFGICRYLVIEDDERTFCQLISSGEATSLLGSGCLLRKHKEIWEAQRELLKMSGKTLKNVKELRNGRENNTSKTA